MTMSIPVSPVARVPGVRSVRPTVRANALYAEYSIGRAEKDGLWVAIGSVRDPRSTHVPPAWILVGTGVTADAAVDDLHTRLEEEEARLAQIPNY